MPSCRLVHGAYGPFREMCSLCSGTGILERMIADHWRRNRASPFRNCPPGRSWWNAARAGIRLVVHRSVDDGSAEGLASIDGLCRREHELIRDSIIPANHVVLIGRRR